MNYELPNFCTICVTENAKNAMVIDFVAHYKTHNYLCNAPDAIYQNQFMCVWFVLCRLDYFPATTWKRSDNKIVTYTVVLLACWDLTSVIK